MTAGRTNHTKFAQGTPMAEYKPKEVEPKTCQSDNDGDCKDELCPQLRDGEPGKSGRSCPLYNWEDPRT